LKKCLKWHIVRGVKALWLQTPQQLADHLQSLRHARGLTQAALGRLVGLDQTRIAKIERDPRVVSLGQLMQLLAVLGVRILLEPSGAERDLAVKKRAAGKSPKARKAADSDEPVEW
jgi:HTH-type transcriptional regulator / antitoxin HipB